MYGVANIAVAPNVPFAKLPLLPAAALNEHAHDAGAETETRRA